MQLTSWLNWLSNKAIELGRRMSQINQENFFLAYVSGILTSQKKVQQ